jgi:hypothetical protein
MKIRSFGEKRPGGQWNGVGDGGSNADAREGERVCCVERERDRGGRESRERDRGGRESRERDVCNGFDGWCVAWLYRSMPGIGLFLPLGNLPLRFLP